MKNFVQSGETAIVAAPSGGVTSGDFIMVGALFGVCQTTELVGDDVAIVREGVFVLPKATGAAWVVGDPLYWDSSAKKFTKVATGNVPVGIAWVAAASGDATGSVSIEAVQEGIGVNLVGGVAAGYKIARAEAALDGSNPTPVATGLTTVVAAVATLKGTAAPGDNTSVLTVDFTGSDGTVNVYAWKNTGGSDPTLVASTGTETFELIAIGT